ncbi:chemotaxis protein CheW [Achromobacter aloeverae]|uniref:Chemotaxis protein CheW n=1 Tax=Achromobacter aloeverae TaxID=1750518 RepID=A0A4V1MRE9_9BURK|nr:chemotaxis protein CheW [Achromobacter aloeverae]RXN83697.1 chemotaxis protein CheW [Achromobacter aloeverae]
MAERDAARIDDCWNRVGIRGDQSCPLLREHIHCRNCPTYAAAARRLLDRQALASTAANDVTADSGDRAAAGGHAESGHASSLSVLVFRLGAEWLALPTPALAEVSTMRAIHTLPRRSGVVTGVCNIRGRLLTCISLPALLGLAPSAVPAAGPAALAAPAKALPRLLILNSAPRAVVAPVDEVEGIRAYAADALGPVPSTLGADRYASAVARHGDRAIGVLDAERVLRAIDRSLA